MKKYIVVITASLVLASRALAADVAPSAPSTVDKIETATAVVGAVCGILGWLLPAPFGGIFRIIGGFLGKKGSK